MDLTVDSCYLHDNLIICLLKKDTDSAKYKFLATPKVSEVFLGGYPT